MTEWWRGAVIYQIYPRSFHDANGDGIGDLAGIVAKLDHVAALGVDGIWVSPFFPSPMKDGGYDVADFCGVDPMFGTIEDYDRLVAEAHRRGLKVIVDQVYSHTSDEHAWFRESRADRTNPKADWYVWAPPKPDGTPPNNWLAVFGGPAWDWEPRRRQYYFHNFLAEQPDLNVHNVEVQEAILDAARFWLDRGTDGFRLDVANFYMHDPLLRDNPPCEHPDPVKPYRLQVPLYNRSRPETLGFMARLRGLLDDYPDRMAVGEIASRNQIEDMVDYTAGPDRLHTAYSFIFLRDRFGARHIRETVETMLAASADAWPSWAFSNHDVMRVVSRWSDGPPSPAFAKLLIALLGALRGTIFMYQGEELGLPQAKVPYERLRDPEGIRFWPDYESRDNARTPMPWAADREHAGFAAVPGAAEPWLPVEPAHRALAVDRQEADPASVLHFTRRYLAWRRRHRALIDGSIHFYDTPEPVLAFARRGRDEHILCAFNLGRSHQRVSLPIPASARRLDGPGLPGELDGGAVDLPGYGAVFAGLDVG
jgi:alpha-glucosidase